MRHHFSMTALCILLGCSGTPVTPQTTPSLFPVIQPAPQLEDYNIDNKTNLTAITQYRDAVDTYIEYLIDYSRRISEQNGLRTKHKPRLCPMVLSPEPIVMPQIPNTVGLDEEQTLEVLLDYVAALRKELSNHNASITLLKTKSQELCSALE